jgi:hypothetical protein
MVLEKDGIWTGCGISEEGQEKRNILGIIRRKKANWIGHILRKNCLIKHVIEGRREGKRGRRRRFQGKGRYWKFKEELLDLTLWGSYKGGR